MNKKCKIVLIDTGIEVKNKLLSKIHIEGVRIKKDKNGYIVERDKENSKVINDNIGHGTAVSGIILSHNQEVEFFVVYVFSCTNQIKHCTFKDIFLKENFRKMSFLRI